MMSTVRPDEYYHRGQGEYFLLYTTAEHEPFHAITFSARQWIDLLNTGEFDFRTGDAPNIIRPAFATLVVGVDGFDFLLREEHNRGLVRGPNWGLF